MGEVQLVPTDIYLRFTQTEGVRQWRLLVDPFTLYAREGTKGAEVWTLMESDRIMQQAFRLGTWNKHINA